MDIYSIVLCVQYHISSSIIIGYLFYSQVNRFS